MAASDIEPRVDYVFKRLFGSEEQVSLLIDLINAVLPFPAGKVVRDLHLLNPFTQQDFAHEKVSILDMLLRLSTVSGDPESHVAPRAPRKETLHAGAGISYSGPPDRR